MFTETQKQGLMRKGYTVAEIQKLETSRNKEQLQKIVKEIQEALFDDGVLRRNLKRKGIL